MTTQFERGARFRQLHHGPGTFVMPNPWDVGTARVLERAGFPALATTSAGHAFASGLRDGQAAREAVLDHVALIAASTPLPVSADLEDCFGDTPADVAATVTAVAERGAVGCSIEDRRRSGELYERDQAVARVGAAVAAARALPFPFTLTARCECFLAGRPDLGETIQRLQAYEAAGADVLYAPGLTTAADLAAVVGAVARPVNAVAGLSGASLPVSELEALGIRRVSLGSTLARVAFGAVLDAVAEMRTSGTFAFADAAVPFAEINALFAA